jgi:hypothetical protein
MQAIKKDGNIHVMPLLKFGFHIPLLSCECCPVIIDSNNGVNLVKHFGHSSDWQVVNCMDEDYI